MIELGDILREMGQQKWVGIATETSLDDVKLATYEAGIYEDYRGSKSFTQDELRQLIREGMVQKVGNVKTAQEGAVRLRPKNDYPHAMDVDRTRAAYEAVENGEIPESFDPDVIFWNAHDHERVDIEVVGWTDDSLADELIRFEDGSVESLPTVVQAMKEGVWILMTPQTEAEIV